MTDRVALIERVARKVCASANAFPCNKAKPICASCLEDADVFIKLVMEEAARVVERRGVEEEQMGMVSAIRELERGGIAAALRAYVTPSGKDR